MGGLAGVRSAAGSCAKQPVLLTRLLFTDDVMMFVRKHQRKIWDKRLVSTFVGQYQVNLHLIASIVVVVPIQWFKKVVAKPVFTLDFHLLPFKTEKKSLLQRFI